MYDSVRPTLIVANSSQWLNWTPDPGLWIGNSTPAYYLFFNYNTTGFTISPIYCLLLNLVLPFTVNVLPFFPWLMLFYIDLLHSLRSCIVIMASIHSYHPRISIHSLEKESEEDAMVTWPRKEATQINTRFKICYMLINVFWSKY